MKTKTTIEYPILSNLPQIADNYAIQNHEDKRIENGDLSRIIYFDTYDVVKLIQGLWAYNSEFKLDSAKFFADRSILVHGFVFKKMLRGQIHLLPPHQDEFAGKFDQSHLFPQRSEMTDELEADFLFHLKLDEIFKKFRDKDIKTDKEFKDYAEKLKVHAFDLFKADYVLNMPFWGKRFKYLLDEKVLVFENSQYDMARIVSQNDFKIIKKAMDITRPSRGYIKSNFVDSLALFLLKEKLDKFKEDQIKNDLPIFYASSPGINRAAEIIFKERRELLHYRVKDDFFPVIRDTDYFIIDTIFKYNDQENHDGDIDEFLSDIQELQSKIREEYNRFDILRTSINRQYEVFQKKTMELIDIEFFDSIWLKRKGFMSLYETLQEFIQYTEEKDHGVQKHVEKLRSKLEKDLKFDFSKVNLLSRIWRSLTELENKLSSDFSDSKGNPNLFSHFGMIKFSFSSRVNERIQKILEVLFSEDEEEIRYQISCIVAFIISGVYNKRSEDFQVGLSILWIFGEYKLISRLCSTKYPQNKDYENYRIAALNGLAILNSVNGVKRNVQKVITCIEKKGMGDNYKVQTLLSLLYFHFWQFKSGRTEIPEIMDKVDTEGFSFEKDYYLLKEAINLARKALDFLQPKRDRNDLYSLNRNQMYLYVLNIYIYFITIGGTRKEFEQLEPFYDRFRKEENREYWQGSFYDTISCYCFRKRFHAKTLEDQLNYWSRAIKRNEQALENMIGNFERVLYENRQETILNHKP